MLKKLICTLMICMIMAGSFCQVAEAGTVNYKCTNLFCDTVLQETCMPCINSWRYRHIHEDVCDVFAYVDRRWDYCSSCDCYTSQRDLQYEIHYDWSWKDPRTFYIGRVG